MQRYQNSVINEAGKPVPSVTITVTVAATPVGSGAAATLYLDNGTTVNPAANVITSDARGNFYFYAADGRYDLAISGGSPAITLYQLADVELADVGHSDDPDEDWIARVINNVRFVNDLTPGANAGAKIVAMIVDLPTTGGTVDARALEGAQTISQNIFAGGKANVTVLLGAATLTITAAQTATANIQTIRGSGYLHTKLVAGSAIAWMFDGATYDGIKLEDLWFDGNGLATGGVRFGTGVSTPQNIRMKDIRIYGVAGTAWDLGGTIDSLFEFVDVQADGEAMTVGLDSSGGDNTFICCRIAGASTVGVDCSATTSSWHGGIFSGNAIDLRVSASLARNTFHGVYFENSTASIVTVAGAYGIGLMGFYGCFFHTLGATNLINLTNATSGDLKISGAAIGGATGTSRITAPANIVVIADDWTGGPFTTNGAGYFHLRNGDVITGNLYINDRTADGGQGTRFFYSDAAGGSFVDFVTSAAGAKGLIVRGDASTGATERMRVRSDGKVVVGSGGSGVELFTVEGDLSLGYASGNRYKITGPAPSAAPNTWTLQDVSDTFVGRDTTDALTNKTLTLTTPLGSASGGTGNGFTKFTGPTTTEKTFTLPNLSATIPTVLAKVDLTAQDATIGATTLYAVPVGGGGQYTVGFNLGITTAAAVPVVDGYWTWTQTGIARTALAIDQVAFASTANQSRYSTLIYADASTNIQYSTTVTGAIGAGKYDLHVSVMKL